MDLGNQFIDFAKLLSLFNNNTEWHHQVVRKVLSVVTSVHFWFGSTPSVFHTGDLKICTGLTSDHTEGLQTGGPRAEGLQTGGPRAEGLQTGGPRAESLQTGGLWDVSRRGRPPPGSQTTAWWFLVGFEDFRCGNVIHPIVQSTRRTDVRYLRWFLHIEFVKPELMKSLIHG